MAGEALSFDAVEVLRLLPEGVLVCDDEQIVRFANPGASRFLGAEPAALEGQPVAALFAARRLPLPAPGARAVCGNSLEIVAQALALQGGAAEGTLYRLSDRPADQAGQRDFLAALAHELRTPLTVIRGMSDLLLRRSESMIQRSQEEFLAAIATRATDMASLVSDSLALVNLESGHGGAEPAWLSLRECLDTALAYLVNERRLPAQQLRYAIDPAAERLWADRDLLRRLLEGLLSHALVVSPPGAPIQIGAVRGAGSVTIQISDGGAPIPVYQRRRLFEHWAYTPRLPSGMPRGTGLEWPWRGRSSSAAAARSPSTTARAGATAGLSSCPSPWSEKGWP